MNNIKKLILQKLSVPEIRQYYLETFPEMGPMDSNGNVKVRCCFHPDTTPSLSISNFTGLYHCFGCGESGDIFKFHMKKHGVGFQEALQFFANRLGVNLKKNKNHPGPILNSLWTLGFSRSRFDPGHCYFI